MIALALLLTSAAFAKVQPEALHCLERFVEQAQKIKGYSATLHKREWLDGKEYFEPVELWVEGKNHIKYKFLKKGTTGIRNNGMTLVYTGGEMMSVSWGEPTGIGVLANRAARSVVGDKLHLTSERALKGELITLNRAGFFLLADAIRFHLPDWRSEKGGEIALISECLIKFTPEQNFSEITLQPGDSIFSLEEKFGTVAFYIQQINAHLFPNLHSLFNRKKEHRIKVPKTLPPFELALDNGTYLPKKLRFFRDGRPLGEYDFISLKTW